MFYVNGNPILENDIDILVELRSQLAANGVHLFNEFKVLQNDIQFNCPIHNGGQERKPSCGITTVRKGTMEAGMVHCFSCGYTATIEEMISNVFGYNDFGRFGTNWLIKNFLTVNVENRKELDLNLSRGQGKQEVKQEYVKESELDKYRYYHPYMYGRGLTDELIEKYDIGFDKDFELKGKKNPSITFPIKDETGKVKYIARRSVHTKLFHLLEGIDKPLYGLYELPEGAEVVMVCESVFDALTAVKYGTNAIALLGTGAANQIEEMKKLKARKLILALDPDEAGRRGTARIRKGLKGYKILTELAIPEGKDLNDLTEEEFNHLEEVF